MRRIMVVLCGLIALAAVYICANVLRFSGVFADYSNHESLSCERLAILPGAEDIVLIGEDDLYFSSTDRRPIPSDSEPGIYWLAGDGTMQLASTDAPDSFQPHGIAQFADPDGSWIYAVSHDGALYTNADAAHSIEVFAVVASGVLRHERSIRHPALRSPNDIAVLSRDQIYVSNDWRFREGLGKLLENYLALPISDVVMISDTEAKVVATGLNFPNGVAISPDLETLWVAESRGRAVTEYAIDQSSGDLAKRVRHPVDATPDNISLTQTGKLLIAGIPNAFDFEKHSKGLTPTTPGLVFELDPLTGKTRNVFYGDGSVISGVTVGLRTDSRLLMGTAFGEHVASCKPAE